MDRKSFQKTLAKRFYPMLREEGFKGSGATLRRLNEPVVHVFNVQGSSGGHGFYLNLGVHLDFLGGPAPGRVLESNCTFRRRLNPIEEPQDCWPYGESEQHAARVIDAIATQWTSVAKPFFAAHGTFPESFRPLVAEQDIDSLHPYYGLIFAKIARELGQVERAKEIASAVLPRVGERATGLKADIQAFIRDVEASL